MTSNTEILKHLQDVKNMLDNAPCKSTMIGGNTPDFTHLKTKSLEQGQVEQYNEPEKHK